MDSILKCKKCGATHRVADNIPDHGKPVKCKCGHSIQMLKADSYYKNNYPKEIAVYILHHKHKQTAFNLKVALKRLEGAEKYFSAKKKGFIHVTEQNANRFIADILRKFGQSQANAFARTLFEFFKVLIEHNLVSKNPFAKIDRSRMVNSEDEPSTDDTEKMNDVIEGIGLFSNKTNKTDVTAKLKSTVKKSKFPDAIPTGKMLIDQYRIEKVLGQGGFGMTYLATDIRLNMLVAIKEFFAGGIATRGNNQKITAKSVLHKEQFQRGLARFIEEARALARFHHQNIVQVNNFFEANGTAYMVMCYEKGASLDAILQRKQTLRESQLMQIVIPLLDGLAELHDAGFIHRDIKPGNIYIRDKDGSPVLLDFGSARQAMGEETKTVTAMLTPGYAPFEQYEANSKRQGPWTDIYSLGAVLYRCIGGHIPAHSTDRSSAILHSEPDPMESASDLSENYSKSFLNAIDWAMQFLEKDRPQTVAQWRECFDVQQEAANVTADDDKIEQVTSVHHNEAQFESNNEGDTNSTIDRIPIRKWRKSIELSKSSDVAEDRAITEQVASEKNSIPNKTTNTRVETDRAPAKRVSLKQRIYTLLKRSIRRIGYKIAGAIAAIILVVPFLITDSYPKYPQGVIVSYYETTNCDDAFSFYKEGAQEEFVKQLEVPINLICSSIVSINEQVQRIKITHEYIDGDSATLEYSLYFDSIARDKSIEMKKIKGEWKIVEYTGANWD